MKRRVSINHHHQFNRQQPQYSHQSYHQSNDSLPIGSNPFLNANDNESITAIPYNDNYEDEDEDKYQNIEDNLYEIFEYKQQLQEARCFQTKESVSELAQSYNFIERSDFQLGEQSFDMKAVAYQREDQEDDLVHYSNVNEHYKNLPNLFSNSSIVKNNQNNPVMENCANPPVYTSLETMNDNPTSGYDCISESSLLNLPMLANHNEDSKRHSFLSYSEFSEPRLNRDPDEIEIDIYSTVRQSSFGE
eukprot:Awhi_evm1s874